MTNIKLTSSNNLTVKIVNKYGASIKENLTVNVNTNLYGRVNIFKYIFSLTINHI
jgi:hypothetical protein